ncbi:MAG: hypothetical protein LBM38_05385 [Clostridiales bacterium]|nr:hypothetical protein [Clostridiales bacterium]
MHAFIYNNKDKAYAHAKNLVTSDYDFLEVTNQNFDADKADKPALTVEGVRNFLDIVPIAPYGDSKVFVIPQADLMLAEAQNALLKVLEEPPAFCTFFLIGNHNLLLPTIRSRCQLMLSDDKTDVNLDDDTKHKLSYVLECKNYPNAYRAINYLNSLKTDKFAVMSYLEQLYAQKLEDSADDNVKFHASVALKEISNAVRYLKQNVGYANVVNNLVLKIYQKMENIDVRKQG